ncbi:D-lactate ferricytochrome c oxidoreductase [Fusarium piperis]|uniref:D-lactate ferricytochrome c oxidoreductase n=1 Tax=Fusarium piperis TaxID=1435070 RepID=A0A9W9BP48_9HYPO|nr:D-lactate ferricytochrome c oxidoreductase [Fusarium piperis]
MFKSKGCIDLAAIGRRYATNLRSRSRFAAQPLGREFRSGYRAGSGTRKAFPNLARPYLPILLSAVAAGATGWFIGERSQPVADSQILYATRAEMERAVDEIATILGKDNVSTDDEILKAHGYSEWSSINLDRLPVAVVYPSSTEDVSKIAKPVNMKQVPYSGGSSVEGHFSAPFGGISVDFCKMNQVLEFHKEE